LYSSFIEGIQWITMSGTVLSCKKLIMFFLFFLSAWMCLCGLHGYSRTVMKCRHAVIAFIQFRIRPFSLLPLTRDYLAGFQVPRESHWTLSQSDSNPMNLQLTGQLWSIHLGGKKWGRETRLKNAMQTHWQEQDFFVIEMHREDKIKWKYKLSERKYLFQSCH
jgi:hypothetical protein